MYVKVRHQQKGVHVHMDVFIAKNQTSTFANVGTLKVYQDEFIHFQSIFQADEWLEGTSVVV